VDRSLAGSVVEDMERKAIPKGDSIKHTARESRKDASPFMYFVFVVSSMSQVLNCEQMEWAHRTIFSKTISNKKKKLFCSRTGHILFFPRISKNRNGRSRKVLGVKGTRRSGRAGAEVAAAAIPLPSFDYDAVCRVATCKCTRVSVVPSVSSSPSTSFEA